MLILKIFSRPFQTSYSFLYSMKNYVQTLWCLVTCSEFFGVTVRTSSSFEGEALLTSKAITNKPLSRAGVLMTDWPSLAFGRLVNISTLAVHPVLTNFGSLLDLLVDLLDLHPRAGERARSMKRKKKQEKKGKKIDFNLRVHGRSLSTLWPFNV